MQALYDELYLPTIKKDTANVNDRVAKGRHSGLELMKTAKAHIIVEIIEYVPSGGVTRTIMKKSTVHTSISSLFDAGEDVKEKISPFDNYIQIVEGTVQVGINDKKYNLRLGEGIVIPAHTTHRFKAYEQFKMISTTIKAGYED